MVDLPEPDNPVNHTVTPWSRRAAHRSERAMIVGCQTTPGEIGYAVHAHPTLSEAFHEAALAVSGESIHFYAPLRQGR